MSTRKCTIFCVAMLLMGSLQALQAQGVMQTILEDHSHFYSGRTLGYWGGGLAVAGVLANTDADSDIQEWYQDDIRSDGIDDLADVAKQFGEGKVTVPVLAGISLLGLVSDEHESLAILGDWGQRSLRGMLLGAPPLLAFQRVLGGSRPTDEDDASWDPFNDSNGVSGHAFMGAVPFLSAAGMTDHLGLKSCFLAGSVLCGLSRVNDDDHYVSQSLLGWWLAYLAVGGVDRTEVHQDDLVLEPVLYHDVTGVAFCMSF